MRDKLERTLRLRDLVVICIGTVIGSGIFIVPATVLRQTGGDPLIALAVWIIAGGLSLLGALTYGEMGAMHPEAGGLYVYMRDAFGPFLAFLYGWTLFFVIASGSIATLAAAFTGYLGQLLPVSALGGRFAAIAMIGTVMLINVYGTRHSASVQTWTTAFKVGAIVLLSLGLLAVGDGGAGAPAAGDGPAVAAALEEPTSMLTAAGVALIAVLWAYEGWQYVTFSAGETLTPQRTFPLGITIGTVALIAIYCLANLGYVAALGPDAAAQSSSIAAAAAGAAFGPVAAKLITIAVLVSIFSAANGLVLTAPRVFFAMARDRVFFRQLATIHPRFGTPAFAVVATCAWAMLLAATGTFEQLLTYVVFTGWIFYALGAASIFSYRRRLPDAHRPFRVPGYPLTPLLFVAASAAIVLNALFTQTGRAMIGIAVVLTGVPAYLVWRSGRRGPEPGTAATSGEHTHTGTA
jgi:APA family basic amino acid/polyamine antiporter